MTSIRVAYLCGEYPRATDTFIQREISGLRNIGIHVDTISVRRPLAQEQGTDEQRRERERTFYLLPCSPWRILADHATELFRSPARYCAALWLALSVRSPGIRSLLYQIFYFIEAGMVAAYMRRNSLHHLHNHAPNASGYVAMIASRLGGCTYSMTLHGFGIFSEPTRWRLQDKLDRCLFAICVSWYGRSQAMLWSDPSRWDRYHVIHCGVEPDQFRMRAHAGRGRRLLYVGRLDPVKGLPVLLDAVRRLASTRDDVHLDIVGDGPLRPHVESIIAQEKLSEHVTLHGYLSQAQLRALQQEVDVMVLTSFAEGLPVVLIEAMAGGLPVVAPRITGIPELIEHGTSGFLYTAGHVDELCSAVESLLDDPDVRSRFARNGRGVVESQFSLTTECERNAAVFAARLAGNPVAIRPELQCRSDTDSPGSDRSKRAPSCATSAACD